MSNVPIPEEELDLSAGRSFWSPKRVARMAIFISMSAVGAMVKVPSPTGTVALDAAFGFFSALTFGWREGAIVAAFGHMLTALTTGFPLSLPMHVFIAVQMAAWVTAFQLLAKKVHVWFGAFVAVLLNGPGSSLLVVPIGGLGLAIALVLPLTIGAAVNVSVAIAAYTIIKRSMMV